MSSVEEITTMRDQLSSAFDMALARLDHALEATAIAYDVKPAITSAVGRIGLALLKAEQLLRDNQPEALEVSINTVAKIKTGLEKAFATATQGMNHAKEATSYVYDIDPGTDTAVADTGEALSEARRQEQELGSYASPQKITAEVLNGIPMPMKAARPIHLMKKSAA